VWLEAKIGGNMGGTDKIGEVLMRRFAKLWRNEAGASAVEYGLVLTIIGLAAIAGMTLLGQGIGDMMTRAGNKMP